MHEVNEMRRKARAGVRSCMKFNAYDAFVYIFCFAFALVCFYPMWFVLINSLTTTNELLLDRYVYLFPKKASIDYYAGILSTSLFLSSLKWSVVKTVLGTLLELSITSAAAYAASKYHLKGMRTINFLFVFTMFFSGGLVPTYFLYKDIGLLKNFLAMVVPMGFSVSNYIIMRNYFSYTVPKELEESALIEGANEVRVFLRIVLPISIPMMAALGLFTAVGHWNDYTSYIYYVNDTTHQPYVWVLRRVLTEGTTLSTLSQQAASNTGMETRPADLQLQMATIICAMLPIMIVYPFLQKYFAKGILLGAVKG